MQNIINKYNIIFIFTLLALLFYPATNVLASESTTLYYYWGNGCPHCARVSSVIDSLKEKYPDLNVVKKEIWYNQENAKEFMQVLKDLNVPESEMGVPFVKIGTDYLVGDRPIIENVYKVIEKNLSEKQQQEKESNLFPKNSISIIAITGAALADSINPCAIAVLIILLSALMILGDKKDAFKSGVFFIFGVYLSYFLLGVGVLSFIKSLPGISNWIYTIVGILAIAVGLSNIKDFFWYGGGGFVTEIPRKWRPKMQEIIKKATSPASAFVVGLIITAFELPCTGGPYFFTLGLLSKNISWSVILPLLVYYNILFISPLVIILLITHFGYTNIKELAEKRKENIRLFHLIAGLIMLILGIWVLLTM